MDHTQVNTESAYALCEGTSFGHTGRGGVGVVVRDGRHRRVAAVSKHAEGSSAARIRFAAIAEALRTCRERGIERVAVYCHDSDVVGQVRGEAEMDPGTRSGCLEVRALMNTFRKAEVRPLPWLANLEAAWLARQAARQPSPEATRRYQPTLPLDAA